MNKKFLPKFLIASILVGGVNFAPAIVNFDTKNLQIISVAHAEIKILEAEGRYTADYDMNESLAAITEHAREDARRIAAEQAAIYVESMTEVVNNQVTKDKIRTYAASIMRVIEEKESSDPSINGQLTVIIKIKVEVDTSKINPEEILGREIQLQKLEEQDKRIRQLEDEKQKLQQQYEQAVSENKKLEIKSEFDKNQKQFLITKYERDLDLFDLDNAVNWSSILTTAEKLQELEPLNATAFRATIYAYREQGDLKKSVDYCNRILNSNCPDDTAIEAYTQLGDIYLNEFNDKSNAKKFVDNGIALCKKNYSATMIEKFVNGTNFQISMNQPVGKTNTIRELYVLKSEIENVIPTFKSTTKIESEGHKEGDQIKWDEINLTVDRIYDIKYKTNW